MFLRETLRSPREKGLLVLSLVPASLDCLPLNQNRQTVQDKVFAEYRLWKVLLHFLCLTTCEENRAQGAFVLHGLKTGVNHCPMSQANCRAECAWGVAGQDCDRTFTGNQGQGGGAVMQSRETGPWTWGDESTQKAGTRRPGAKGNGGACVNDDAGTVLFDARKSRQDAIHAHGGVLTKVGNRNLCTDCAEGDS
jgi:hypothetical protein